jgi:hypothetical protein
MRNVHILLLAIALRSLASDAQVLHWIPDVPDHVGDFRGRIVDAISGQPINGAVVVAFWEVLDEVPIPRIGPHDQTFSQRRRSKYAPRKQFESQFSGGKTSVSVARTNHAFKRAHLHGPAGELEEINISDR